MRNINLALRIARIKAGLTQLDLALETKINSSYISQIERGVLTPRPRDVRVISEVLKVKPQEIFPKKNSIDEKGDE
jgi:transcriptional regulator with XRE-family HTH domain